MDLHSLSADTLWDSLHNEKEKKKIKDYETLKHFTTLGDVEYSHRMKRFITLLLFIICFF